MSSKAKTSPPAIKRPERPTLFHIQWYSSSRPAYVLMELGLAGADDSKLDIVTISHAQLAEDAFLTGINPQKRLPIFHDPIKNLTLTESGGLVQYLLESYDKDNKLTVPIGDPRRPDFLQLIHFGPASGYHICVPILFRGMPPEGNEALATPEPEFEKRKAEWRKIIVPTLERALDKCGGPFLLGKDFTAADVVCGYEVMTVAFSGVRELIEDYPKIKAYHAVISERDVYKKLYPPPSS